MGHLEKHFTNVIRKVSSTFCGSDNSMFNLITYTTWQTFSICWGCHIVSTIFDPKRAFHTCQQPQLLCSFLVERQFSGSFKSVSKNSLNFLPLCFLVFAGPKFLLFNILCLPSLVRNKTTLGLPP